MRIQPLHAQLLVRPHAAGSTTKGGLLVPSIAMNNAPYRYGDVVEVGRGRINANGINIPLQVEAGQVIAYAKNAGLEVPIETDDGEEVLTLIDEKFVLGIVHGLERPSILTGIDGRLLMMQPSSRAMPDSAAKNREELERAERMGFTDPTEHDDEPNGMTG
jgi:co-chaperonin GroES (HSP10)